jgi:hypothetical protein
MRRTYSAEREKNTKPFFVAIRRVEVEHPSAEGGGGSHSS